MTIASRRRFTPVDGFILVAATLVGLVLVWAVWPDLASIARYSWRPRARMSIRAYESSIVAPILTAWTIAIIALRLRTPRPRPGTLAREPGVAACLAALIAISTELLWALAIEIGVPDRGWRSRFVFQPVCEGAPYAIAGAWLAIAMIGRWTAASNWVDRLGRIIGLLWMIAFLGRLICFVVIDLLPAPTPKPPLEPPPRDLFDLLVPEAPR